MHAVALDRGELIGKAYQGPGSAYTEVTVPALFADGNHFPCYAFKPRVHVRVRPTAHVEHAALC